MISQPVRHLELSTRKGTKNVRETSDMVGWAAGVFVNEKNERMKNFEHRMNRMKRISFRVVRVFR